MLSLWWHSGLFRHLMLHFGGSTIFSMPHGSFFFFFLAFGRKKNTKGVEPKKKKRAWRPCYRGHKPHPKEFFFPLPACTSSRMAVPQEHDTDDVRVHCRHGPVWHKVWHTWFWQVSLRPQLFFFLLWFASSFFFFWKWEKEKNGREREREREDTVFVYAKKKNQNKQTTKTKIQFSPLFFSPRSCFFFSLSVNFRFSCFARALFVFFFCFLTFYHTQHIPRDSTSSCTCASF